MSHNNLVALNLVVRAFSGVCIVAGGIYLILHDHPTAGGWTIFAGFLVAAVRVSWDGEAKS